MHLLVLYDREICYRYRVAAYAPLLAAQGWSIEAHWLERGLTHRLAMIRRAAEADVVLLQRRLVNGWSRWMLRRAARRLIFDFDDAIYLRDSNSPKPAHSLQRRRRFAASVRMADAVTAGNQHLVEQAAAHTPSKKIHLAPTCVDPSKYPLSDHWRQNQSIKLAWIGTGSTLASLEHLRGGLVAAAAETKGLHLRVVCDQFPCWDDFSIEPRTWSQPREAADVAEADIGISWLPDHAWSQGKCGLKVLQYMAAGLPVVANPVGVHKELIEHGRTGFLAETPKQWAEAIGKLARKPTLRHMMGHRARQLVENRYSTTLGGESLVAVLERLTRIPQLTVRRKAA